MAEPIHLRLFLDDRSCFACRMIDMTVTILDSVVCCPLLVSCIRLLVSVVCADMWKVPGQLMHVFLPWFGLDVFEEDVLSDGYESAVHEQMESIWIDRAALDDWPYFVCIFLPTDQFVRKS